VLGPTTHDVRRKGARINPPKNKTDYLTFRASVEEAHHDLCFTHTFINNSECFYAKTTIECATGCSASIVWLLVHGWKITANVEVMLTAGCTFASAVCGQDGRFAPGNWFNV